MKISHEILICGLLIATDPLRATALSRATPLEWSMRMANSEIRQLGVRLESAPVSNGRWDYTTGMFADSLIRLTHDTNDPKYEKNAEATIGSFIGPSGKIATYQNSIAKRRGKPEENTKREPGSAPSPLPSSSPSPVSVLANGASGKPAIPYSLDEVQSGVATLKLYDITREERYRKAADILREQLRHHPRTREGGFFHKASYPNQMWLDGLYMGEPFYADYAVRFNEQRDFADIAHQFEIVGAHTFDPKTGLFYHGWDESKKQPWANPATGASPNFWSRAIGWYVMGLVDVLDVMPKDNPDRPALIALLEKSAAGIAKYQDRKTGVWWQVTDEPGRPRNFMESTASCMFVYALAKGVNDGWLPRSYIPVIRRGYEGVLHQFVKADPGGDGMSLTQCCEVAGLDSKGKGSYDYYVQRRIVSNDLKGVAPFINAGMECQRLFDGEKFAP